MGALPPRYSFVLNPRVALRYTTCPRCQRKTRIRKIPLVIHVDGAGLVVLRKACRLCVLCEILVAHQAEIEPLIESSVGRRVAGKPKYLILGTVEPRVWRGGVAGGISLDAMVQHMSDFKAYMKVEFTPGGWYPANQGLANTALEPAAARPRVKRCGSVRGR